MPGVSNSLNEHDKSRSSRIVISDEYLIHAQNTFLNKDQLGNFVNACNRPLRKSIRVNTLKITLDEFKKIFQQYELNLEPIPWCPTGFWLSAITKEGSQNLGNLGNLAEHLQGLFYIQESSSMLPPMALLNRDSLAKRTAISTHSDNESGESRQSLLDISPAYPLILDFAAAPGSKTTQLASMVENAGLILANEISSSRIKVLHANLVRCGVTNTCMTQFDGRKLGERLSGQFDFVLLDAPCSGEGTVRKDVNALKLWHLSNIMLMADLQKQLILTAYQCLKPGGRLVYSTCTLSPEENQQIANYLLSETDANVEELGELFNGAKKARTPQGFLHVLPQTYDSEGFFVAAFNKPLASTTNLYANCESPPFEALDQKTQIELTSYYQQHFGLELNSLAKRFKQRGKEIWMFPWAFEQISQLVRLNRSGIKLAQIYPNKIRSSHEFASCLGANVSRQKLELNAYQANEFYKGRNIDVENTDIEKTQCKPGEVLLFFQGQVIGIGTLANNKIKNQLPRDLVKDQINIG